MPMLMENLEKLLNRAQQTWEDEQFQQRLQDVKVRLSEVVRRSPMGSMGVAVLAGFLIGKIFNKKG